MRKIAERTVLRSPWLAIAVVVICGAGEARAGDGVLEISQVCAERTGCFPGDTAGFPVTVTALAPTLNVRLTSDLVVTGGSVTAIDVTAQGATVDLGGFRIVGPSVCSNVPVTSCTNTGSGVGVLGASDTAVKHGTITGMGNDGVRLDYSARVESLQVYHNASDGIVVGSESIVSGNIVASNGGDGVQCGEQCGIHENTSTGNQLDGIDLVSGSVTSNTASLNGGAGGRFGNEVAFANNQLSGNALEDVTGGHASGGNVCEDGSCSRRGARRYYLTSSIHAGDSALTACSPGFHMAHLSEIHATSGLEYDVLRGATLADSGKGPPLVAGWARTGDYSTGSLGTGSLPNCLAWTTSALGQYGTVAMWADDWSAASEQSSPWTAFTTDCAVARSVWCVED